MRTATATWAQDREFLQHDLELRIALHQVEHVGHSAFAIAAIVIEELDEGDVAVLVAEHNAARRIENRRGVFGNARFMLLSFVSGLSFAQLRHGLFQHLGVRDEIALDDGLDIALLGIGKTLRRCGRRRSAKRQREQCGSEQAEGRHW